MCGIAGYAALDGRQPLHPGAARAMLGCIAHRGPDDEGVHASPGVVLGHRRLSVIDLEGGHQPLYGARPGTVIIANGEIYNYRELTEELRGAGHRFATHSDTEVAAHAYDRWGLDFLDRLDGMFALALWDAEQHRLVLARDRLGEKPLFYTSAGGMLIFASELSAVLAHPAVEARLDPAALAAYLAVEYVPAPATLIAGVHKLEPGHMLVLEAGKVHVSPFWTLQARPPAFTDYGEAVTELRRRLEQAVRSRLVADVPLGVFLSGGIDSSTIAAFAARAGALETFSIGFAERSFDESAHARRVADHIGSRHHEHRVTAAEMPELVPGLGALLDEPIGDASILPTAVLSRFARRHVTVALGGDGGDELFAGYPMHQAHRVAAPVRALPGPLRNALAATLRHWPVSHRNFDFRFKALTFLRGAGAPAPENHLLWMSSFPPAERRSLLAPDLAAAIGGRDLALDTFRRVWQGTEGAPPLARATHLDALTYLPNDILTKVDRASMAVALEVRAPFLARDVVEFAFALPDAWRMKHLVGKRILRDAVRDLLPHEILERPKKGFGMPVAAWLAGTLRPLVRDVLAPDSLRATGLFDATAVTRLLDEHDRRAADHRKPLWTLLVFELWRRHHLGGGIVHAESVRHAGGA